MNIKVSNLSLLLFFLVLGIYASAQTTPTIYVEYSYKNATFDSFREILYADQGRALTVLEPKFLPADRGGASIDSTKASAIGIRPVTKDRYTSEERILKYLDSPELMHQTTYKGIGYLLTDSMPDMPWQLIANDTKTIGNYKCYRADLHFRGYHVTAYYTPEIPIRFGPWKFKGLPGLILEITDQSERSGFNWIANRIVFPYEKQVEFEIAEGNLNKLSQQEYIAVVDKVLKEGQQKIYSRIPKDVKISAMKSYRPSLEQRYEWED